MSRIISRTFPQLEQLEDRLVLNAGALDASFGIGGIVKIPSDGLGIAQKELIQPDGKVILGGFLQISTTALPPDGQLAIVRLLPNGSLDSSFGSNGQVTIPSAVASLVSLALQPDGKLLAVTPLGGSLLVNFGFQITRFLPDGEIDEGFGTDGSVKIQNMTGGVLALQPDGKLLLAGDDNTFNNESGTLAISRLNADGTLDVTFGTNGFAKSSLSPSQAVGLGIQSDGHIVVASSLGTSLYLSRFSSAGRLDYNFGTGGVEATTDLYAPTMVISPNGMIIIAGTQHDVNTGVIVVAQFAPNGLPDKTFGADGRAELTDYAVATSVALDSSGRIVVGGGSTQEAEATNLLVGRLNPDGSKDVSFGFEGIAVGGIQHRVPGGTSASAVAVQPDGSVVAVGQADGSFVAVRYTNDTSLPTAEQRFVAQVYLDLLYRPVESAALSAWSGLLLQGVTHQSVSFLIQSSPESQQKIVRTLYSEYLHRQPDQLGLAAWTSFLATGGTRTALSIAIASSPEFLENEGAGTTDGFLDAIYQSALNRSVDSGSRSYWSQFFNQGGTTTQAAGAIFSSPEYRSDVVTKGYNSYLRRAGDAEGIANYTQALAAGVSDAIFISVLLGSDEYFHRTVS